MCATGSSICDSVGSNSSLYTCIASTLPSEPSLQSLEMILSCLFVCLYFICIGVLPACMKESDLLEGKLQTVVS